VARFLSCQVRLLSRNLVHSQTIHVHTGVVLSINRWSPVRAPFAFRRATPPEPHTEVRWGMCLMSALHGAAQLEQVLSARGRRRDDASLCFLALSIVCVALCLLQLTRYPVLFANYRVARNPAGGRVLTLGSSASMAQRMNGVTLESKVDRLASRKVEDTKVNPRLDVKVSNLATCCDDWASIPSRRTQIPSSRRIV
jgi:hypothetical protein